MDAPILFNPKIGLHRRQQGITAFEFLRSEWTESHPNHTELELLEACRQFAKLSGLPVREQIYLQTLNDLMGL